MADEIKCSKPKWHPFDCGCYLKRKAQERKK